MVAVAVRIVRRVSLDRRAVCQFVGGMREDAVPPVEEFSGVARAGNGVFTGASTSGDYSVSSCNSRAMA